MSTLLLRKLALKSLMKFGNFKELTVQELLIMNKHYELIKIYYRMSMIDFNDEIKDILKLTGERVIPKPGKRPELYKTFVGEILDEIYNENRMTNDAISKMQRKEKVFEDKNKKIINMKKSQNEQRPIFNRTRNQNII